ncbi:MAG: hypothetical protein LBC96_05850 [Lachnospiraceae bacterium]|jgi:V/A-type H+-transporting ATPase subunit E|nr:hypothetical protein [Lachnospiraceae bacterium]
MEVHLSQLIEKIKAEGIETAKAEAAAITDAAHVEAEKILTAAKGEADTIVRNARQMAVHSEKAGTAAITHASRNLLISFKNSVQDMLDKLIADRVSEVYGIDVVREVLPQLIKNWNTADDEGLSVLIAAEDWAKLDDYFYRELYASMKEGVVIKPAANIEHGFHIVERDGAAFYDFSAAAVAEMLSAYLTPALTEMLKKPEGE